VGQTIDLPELKKIWEKVRVKKLDPHERRAMIDRILPFYAKDAASLARKPFHTRVLRFLLKNGNKQQRTCLISQFRGRLAELAVDVHATKVVERLAACFRWDPETARASCQELAPAAQTLCLNAVASRTLSYVYQCAPIEFQNMFVANIVGPAVALNVLADGTEASAERRKLMRRRQLSLLQVNAEVPGKRQLLLSSLIQVLSRAEPKGLLGNVIFTGIALETVKIILQGTSRPAAPESPLLYDPEHEANMQWLKGFASSVVEDGQLMYFVDNPQGAQLASYIIYLSTPKARKDILKLFRPHVIEMATDPVAFVPLVQLFACMDDTVSISTSLISSPSGINASLQTLLQSRSGCRVLCALLSTLAELGRTGAIAMLPAIKSQTLSAPQIIDLQPPLRVHSVDGKEETEQKVGGYKKPLETKQRELAAQVVSPLLHALSGDSAALAAGLARNEMVSTVISCLAPYLTEESLQTERQALFAAIAEAGCVMLPPRAGINSTSGENEHKPVRGKFGAHAPEHVAAEGPVAPEEAPADAEEAAHAAVLAAEMSSGDASNGAEGSEGSGDSECSNSSDSSESSESSDSSDSSESSESSESQGHPVASLAKTASAQPMDAEPLYKHNVGYYSLRHLIQGVPGLAKPMWEAISKTNPVFLSEKRGAFTLEHLVHADPGLIPAVRELVNGQLSPLMHEGDKGCQALLAALG